MNLNFHECSNYEYILFSVVMFSHGRTALIKKLIKEKFFGKPNNIFGLPGFHMQCAVGVSERVPP